MNELAIDSHNSWLLNRNTGKRFEKVGGSIESSTIIDLSLCEGIFRNVTFKDILFTNSSLQCTTFSGCIFINVKFIGCDLRESDFRGSAIKGIEFSNCNMSYVVGDGIAIKSLQLGKYHVVLLGDKIFIGCKSSTIIELTELASLSDDIVESVGEVGCASWWNRYKALLLNLSNM